MRKALKWDDHGWVVLSLLVSCLLGAPQSWAAEETYPSKPINLIVGFAAGGASDLGSKVVAEKLPEFLGQRLVPTYKPGGGGTLSASYVAKAKPDGYTVLVMVSFMYIPPELEQVDYTLDDFILTGMYARTPYFAMVKADSRWKYLKDFVEDARKNPGKLNVGSGGVNTGGDFVQRLLGKEAGVQLVHVPFKGCSAALPALLGGHIDADFCVGAGGAQEANMVRTLAVAEEKRLEDLPQVPTFKELGYPVTFSTWYTFAFPKGTPKQIVDVFSGAQEKAIKKYSKEITESLGNLNMWPVFMDRERTRDEFINQYNLIKSIAQ
jgi:tripartite-type tricarboxylate transporter receptor subunit TctC